MLPTAPHASSMRAAVAGQWASSRMARYRRPTMRSKASSGFTLLPPLTLPGPCERKPVFRGTAPFPTVVLRGADCTEAAPKSRVHPIQNRTALYLPNGRYPAKRGDQILPERPAAEAVSTEAGHPQPGHQPLVAGAPRLSEPPGCRAGSSRSRTRAAPPRRSQGLLPQGRPRCAFHRLHDGRYRAPPPKRSPNDPVAIRTAVRMALPAQFPITEPVATIAQRPRADLRRPRPPSHARCVRPHRLNIDH